MLVVSKSGHARAANLYLDIGQLDSKPWLNSAKLEGRASIANSLGRYCLLFWPFVVVVMGKLEMAQ